MTGTPTAPDALAAAVRAADRKALARAITLVESTRARDRERAEALLTTLLPFTGHALRIGISGAPGVGKSTFIEAFGEHITGLGTDIAVLAVDPSSRRFGGSILGDKTRMTALARNRAAFIRPTPSGTTPGGVARRTRETILLAEAAGFQSVVVETVGVGQAETAVADMVDLVLLLIGPGGGDDLQGIKRGAMELADVVIITKADGDFAQAATRALADYGAALTLMRPKHPGMPLQIFRTSAVTGEGVAEVWAAVQDLGQRMRDGGVLETLRQTQARAWFWSEVRAVLSDAIDADAEIAAKAANLEAKVVAGAALPDVSARALVRLFRGVDGKGAPP
ncbi:MAG TPA: methylmalonyl Co-A mutase-associated GTPase MeaB [Rhizomicrobium sp.]|nr:methylmalonyl Co-A mutase-associated GTPase MeaB [Rhizomicrobium sp.]